MVEPTSDVEVIFFAMITRNRHAASGKQILEWTNLSPNQMRSAINSNPALFRVQEMDVHDPLGFSVGIISSSESDRLGRRFGIDFQK
jgi:hypothetical protein